MSTPVRLATHLGDFCAEPGTTSYFAATGSSALGRDLCEQLTALAAAAPSGSARLCLHTDTEATLHEMVIAHEHRAYIRPHRHPAKHVSFHAISGEADLVLFDSGGRIATVVRLGPATAAACQLFRLEPGIFYTQVIRTRCFVFHESIVGPLTTGQTEWAEWAPRVQDQSIASIYWNTLREQIAAFPPHE